MSKSPGLEKKKCKLIAFVLPCHIQKVTTRTPKGHWPKGNFVLRDAVLPRNAYRITPDQLLLNFIKIRMSADQDGAAFAVLLFGT